MTGLKQCLLIVGVILLLPDAAGPAQAQDPEEGWQTYTSADGLANDYLRSIAEDRGGRLWFGTPDGASVLDDGDTPFDKGDDTWTTFTTADGLADNSVWAITAGGEGRLWFGTYGGASVLDDGGTPFDKGDDTWISFTESDGLTDDYVRAVAMDSGGGWWFGTRYGGVSVLGDGGTPFDKGDDTWTTFTTTDGLADNYVRDIAADGGGRLWFGTYDGVSVLDDGGTPFDKGDDIWTTFTTADSLTDNDVMTIAADGGGRLWFGTYGGGASVLDDGGTPFDKGDDTWTTFTTADGLVDNIVRVMVMDGGGRLWFATMGGVSVLDDAGTPFDKGDDTWTTFTTADGLANDIVRAMVVDGGGQLWFGTSGGGVSVLADAVVPSSDATSPEYANGAIPVPWSASDGASGVFGATLWVKYGSGGTWIDTELSQRGESDGTFNYTPTQGDGIYYFATVAEDWMGNTEPTPTGSGDDSTAYDTTAPDSNATSPDYDNSGDIAVSWTASDATSGVSSTVLWAKYGSGGSWASTSMTQAGTSGMFNYTPAHGDGTYYFATVAEDWMGNTESTPTDSGDDSAVYDTTDPDSSASSPDYDNAGDIAVSWTASDATSGVSSTALWVKYGNSGSWASAGLAQAGTSGSFDYTPTHGDGTYYFATVASDNAGNIEATPTGSGDASTVYDSTPTLYSISNTDGDGDYVVDWSDVSGATGYTLQEDDNPSFSSPTTRYSGSNSQFTITGQPAGTWHYRVSALNAGGDSMWSNVQSVTVNPVAAPSIPTLYAISNADGDGDYVVDWSDVTGATGYTLQEDGNPSFSSPTTRYSGADSQCTITDQAAGTWHYRVSASNAGGDSTWSSAHSVTVKAWGYLPLILRNYPPLVVENGGFESGDFTGWQHGGELHQFVRTTYPHAGRYSALLGDPAYGNDNVPSGSAWVYQTIQVPSTGSPTFSFWYRIFTYDVLWSETHQCYYDYFDVYIQDTNGQTLEHILRDGYTGTWEKDTLQDLGWKHFSYDLSGYTGQTIRIAFANFNTPGATGDPGLNTYTYLDDVVVSR